jgi:hypothetical protein
MASTDFTINDVLAWARTKPAGEEYDYCDAKNCAVAQFGKETGREHLISLGYLGRYPDLKRAVQDSAAIVQCWTFGALVTRLEALCPETPQSEWTRLDAYMVETVPA